MANTQMENKENAVAQRLEKGSPVNIILLFLVVGIALYGTFLKFDQSQVINKTSELEKTNQDVQLEIDKIRGSKVEVSQNASEALKEIESGEVRWSDVITQVNKLLPVDNSNNRKINVLSYSGSGTGRIALNMVTQPSSNPPFGDVANLIAAFNNSIFFKDAFVPAISKGLTDDGGVTLSFVLNMEYQKQETGSDDLSLPVVESPVKVLRNN